MKSYRRGSEMVKGLKTEMVFNKDNNSFGKIIKRIIVNYSIVFSLPVTALIIGFSNIHVSSFLFYLWFAIILWGITLKRPPAHYNSYKDWFNDRDNWYKCHPNLAK